MTMYNWKITESSRLYRGPSHLPKPEQAAVGDVLLETDTGRSFKWSGDEWLPSVDIAEALSVQTMLLNAILDEVRAAREEKRTGLHVFTGLGG